MGSYSASLITHELSGIGIIKTAKNRLQVTQHKIIRFILKLDPNSHHYANMPMHNEDVFKCCKNDFFR